MTDLDHWYSEETATLGDRLAGAREALGLEQKELAARIGVKARTVADWENDVKDPRANRLQMLSGVLNVSIAWLLTGIGDGPGAPGDAAPTEAEAILDEMRDLRGRIAELTGRLGVLEAKLRGTLRA